MNQPLRILISHLTRMKYPKICIAGIEVNTGIHVRPVIENKNLDLSQVESLFQLGRVIDLGQYTTNRNVPEVEDCFFVLANVIQVSDLAPPQFWNSLKAVAKPSLNQIFGDDLHSPNGHTLAIPKGCGIASLGELCVSNLRLVITNWNDDLKLRAEFSDSEINISLSVPVTDLRFYEHIDGNFVVKTQVVNFVNKILSSNQVAILSVGLSRVFKDEHWLQVNGIHLESDPLWHV
jgi:hypothetical protein